MKLITLDMAMSAERARVAWEELPDKASTAQRSAFWRRFQTLRAHEAGTLSSVSPVSYAGCAAAAPKNVGRVSNPAPPTPSKSIPKPIQPTKPVNTDPNQKLSSKIIVPRLRAIIAATGHAQGGISALCRGMKLPRHRWDYITNQASAVPAEFVEVFAATTGARFEYLIDGDEPKFGEGGPIKCTGSYASPAPAKPKSAAKPKYVRVPASDLKTARRSAATARKWNGFATRSCGRRGPRRRRHAHAQS